VFDVAQEDAGNQIFSFPSETKVKFD